MAAKLTSSSDAELILQCRNGDQSAYGQIVQRYQSLVCSVAYNRCGDLAMSEDLAQEAFIQAWEKLADLSDVTKFKAWICTIVRNMATRSSEKANRNVSSGAAQLDSVVEPTSTSSDPSASVISAEQEQLVWQALAAIPENYREPMILFYREEQSVSHVAEALEISKDAVKQRLSRGRKFLQQQLTATVEATLENSKPSDEFASAVILGLASAKLKTATAGTAASVAAKTATGTGLASYLIPLSSLPFIAWCTKMQLEETRSPTERQIWIRWIVFWALALIPLVALGWAFTIGPYKIDSPFVIPALQVLYCIPMIISARWAGKRVTELRIKENTATAPRNLVSNSEDRGSKTRLFVGSGLLVVLWPAIMQIITTDWISAGLLFLSAVLIGLMGARFCGKQPERSFRVYTTSLGVISLIGVAVIYFRPFGEFARLENHTFWYMATLHAIVMTQAILSVVMWRRVHGKAK